MHDITFTIHYMTSLHSLNNLFILIFVCSNYFKYILMTLRVFKQISEPKETYVHYWLCFEYFHRRKWFMKNLYLIYLFVPKNSFAFSTLSLSILTKLFSFFSSKVNVLYIIYRACITKTKTF